MGIEWTYNGNIMGIEWKYHGKIMGIEWDYIRSICTMVYHPISQIIPHQWLDLFMIRRLKQAYDVDKWWHPPYLDG